MGERLLEGDPQGQSPEEKPEVNVDPSAGDGKSTPTDWREDPRFKGDNLDDVVAKMYGTVRNQEQLLGKHGQEVGEARKKLEKYEQFYESEYVQLDDGTIVHKSMANRQQPKPIEPHQPAQPAQSYTPEQLEEQFALLSEVQKVGVITELVTNAVRTNLLGREKAYKNPLLESNEAAMAKAIEYEQQGYAPELAARLAVGDLALEIASGKSRQSANPANIGRAISSINMQDRTFMQPNGRILQPKESEPKLTQGQIDMAIKLGQDPKEVEPYAGR